MVPACSVSRIVATVVAPARALAMISLRPTSKQAQTIACFRARPAGKQRKTLAGLDQFCEPFADRAARQCDRPARDKQGSNQAVRLECGEAISAAPLIAIGDDFRCRFERQE